jgi:hypothetical protein
MGDRKISLFQSPGRLNRDQEIAVNKAGEEIKMMNAWKRIPAVVETIRLITP